MAQASIDAVIEASSEISLTTPLSPASGPIQDGSQGGRRLKGRKKLLLGLQRNLSSSSLSKLTRSSSSSGYRSTGLASMSCVSLSDTTVGSSYIVGTSYSSEMSTGYSTAPTSVANTPGAEVQTFEEKVRLRLVGAESSGSVGLPSELRPSSPLGLSGANLPEIEEDYFSRPLPKPKKKVQKRKNINFWADMPTELRIQILSYLEPKEIVRCSSVSKAWHNMCFDGQLWSQLDASNIYRDIPADSLINIITSAGPFMRDLNLRGCVQLRDRWITDGFADACRNLENFSLEGCRIDRASIHCFLLQNSRLRSVNLSGLTAASNATMKILAHNCPKVENLNISWCNNVDNRGLKKVVDNCPNLRDLRAGEVRCWDDAGLMESLFNRNSLERLLIPNCDSLSDDSLAIFMTGINPEIDILTSLPMVPPRNIKHLDLTRCRGVSDRGIKSLAHNMPYLEGLNLSKNHTLTDASLTTLLPTLPNLTHLDLEELSELTNETLKVLSASPCSRTLRHMSISYCENLGDSGMLPVLKTCTMLESLDMDNTRISDLVLTEAAALVSSRNRLARGLRPSGRPSVGLRMVAYDCANVTWMGVREVLSRNTEITKRPDGVPTYPSQYINLKAFYNWQPTVEEHTKRVMRGDWSAASRLERKWAEFMILSEEAGAAGGRRRRRRAREAMMVHVDEEEGGGGVTVGGGRRRRARSGPGGCSVM